MAYEYSYNTTPANVDAFTRDVEGNQLVQNQLTGLLDDDSAYIEQARQQALTQANSRGLMNSSLAAGAGQAAAIRSALPIAQQDASTFSGTAAQNMDAENAARLAQLQSWTSRANAGTAASSAMSRARLQAEITREQMAEDARRYDIDWQRQQALNDRNSQASIFSTFMNNVAANPDMWINPTESAGYVNYFANTFSQMWDDLHQSLGEE